MGFLNNVIRNRALIENLSREPLARSIDPISPNPFGNFPIMPMPIAPRPVDDPIGPAPIPRPIPAPVLPPVFNQPIVPPIAPPAIDRPILQKPIIPPRRDDFMSIERIDEPRDEFIPSMPNENPIPFVPPLPIQDPADYTAYTATPSIGSIGDIPISEGDPLNLILNPVLKQPQPIGVPSLMDPRQPMPNLATGIIDPVSQPIQQLPQGPQPIPQVPLPVMPPMREVPPEDFGFGPGIRRSEDFFREEDLVMPPMAPPKPLGEDVPPMPIENMIMANDPAIMPMPSKMPMLPEPMPMPMSMRPRMPMPGPIATPMPMAPTNLQLPQIETQMPMMSLDRGIGSFKTLV